MSTLHLLDPEIRATIVAWPKLELTPERLPALRRAISERWELVDPAEAGVSREGVTIPGLTPQHPEVRCLLYRPEKTAPTGAGYLHVHGGGYLLGAPEISDGHNAHLASELGITILSVDYRLAPEHPIPAPLDDCYAALGWLHQNAADLGLDRERIGVGGESAGGGLAAATVLHSMAEGLYPVCFQALTYPMIDDRTGAVSHPGDPLTGEFIWTRERNQMGWSSFLGDAEPAAPFVPARAEALDGLPPTWIGTAELDLFRDENIRYAQRLMGAGVHTELIVYPRTCHGFQLAADASVTRRYLRDHLEALRRGLLIGA